MIVILGTHSVDLTRPPQAQSDNPQSYSHNIPFFALNTRTYWFPRLPRSSQLSPLWLLLYSKFPPLNARMTQTGTCNSMVLMPFIGWYSAPNSILIFMFRTSGLYVQLHIRCLPLQSYRPLRSSVCKATPSQLSSFSSLLWEILSINDSY